MFRIQTSSLGLINQSSLQNAPNPNLFSPKEVYNDYDEEPNAAPKSYRNNMILATSTTVVTPEDPPTDHDVVRRVAWDPVGVPIRGTLRPSRCN